MAHRLPNVCQLLLLQSAAWLDPQISNGVNASTGTKSTDTIYCISLRESSTDSDTTYRYVLLVLVVQ